MVPKILYPIFLPLCCVIPSYKAPLQAVEPAAALWQPCPALWEHLQAKHRNSRGWSNPSLHCRDHMRNICTSSCLLPSYPPKTQCASQLLKQTKEKRCCALPATAAHYIACKESPKYMYIYVAGECISDQIINMCVNLHLVVGQQHFLLQGSALETGCSGMPLAFCPGEDFPLPTEILAGAQTDCLEGDLKLTHLTYRWAHS